MKAVVKEKATFEDYDIADDIETTEDVAALLAVALEENDPDFLLSVVGDIARSQGMTQIAKEMNLDRRGLYRALALNGNPSFKTVFKLLDILGLQVRVEPKAGVERFKARGAIMGRQRKLG